MFRKICITSLLSLLLLALSFPVFAAERVYTNDDLEKYKSKKEKQMTEDDKIKESDRNLRNKERQMKLEEKMWKSLNKDNKSVTVEKD